LQFVDDLSAEGFGLGGAVTGGLTLRVSDDIGIHSEISGRLVRFRRIYRYWDTGIGWRETGMWQWGRILSLSVGVQFTIR
jgi:hypothetical protein